MSPVKTFSNVAKTISTAGATPPQPGLGFQNRIKVTPRLPGLDGLRAIAVSWVILAHFLTSHRISPTNAVVVEIARMGGFGVELFFVLSGFLITWLLLREEEKSGSIDLKAFYLRRAFRILPPALAFLAAMGVLVLWGKIQVPAWDFVSTLLFFRNFVRGPEVTGHYWSLAIEEQFYWVWPVLFLFLSRDRRLYLTAALILLAPVWRKLNGAYFGSADVNWMRTDLRYDALLMGCFLAAVLVHPRFSKMLNAPVFTSQWGVPVAVVSIVLLNSSLLGRAPGAVKLLTPSVSFVLVALIIRYLIQGKRGWVDLVFNFKPLVGLGLISYSLYLWQQPFCLVNPRDFPVAFSPGVAVFVSVVLAVLSHFFIERPALRLRSRFTGAAASH